ncbi:hypothetical protein AB0D35_08145 [Streptomyces sp. NPDC048301]|uniref:hypothetical protein n=1 Tax=Streptomyces sp. NPDC048301 TaxID=3155631 RepID=UPI0034198B31
MTPRRSAGQALAATALLLASLAACGAGRDPGGAEARRPPSSSAQPGATGTPPPRPSGVPSSSAPPPAASSAPPSAPAEPAGIAGPDLSRTTGPPAAPSGEAAGTGSTGPAAVPSKSPSAPPPASPDAATRSTATTLRIGEWSARVVRGGQEEVDACQDAVQWAGPPFGAENGYEMRTIVVVGHDHCGFQQFATLRTGTVVTVDTPRETLTYRVYARYLTPGRGAPAHGLYWGDLTLQSCVGPDTGFTYLSRV